MRKLFINTSVIMGIIRQLTISAFLFGGYLNIHAWEQKDFVIGTYTPPLVSPDIVYLPGDFDGDGYSDMSIIIRAGSHAGDWLLDYHNNTFERDIWEECHTGYTDEGAQYKPGDYDGDGDDDLCMMTPNGVWKIDVASNGFGSWDSIIPAHSTYIPYDISEAVICPADYNGLGTTDLCIRLPDGRWHVDYAENGFGVWDNSYNDQITSEAIPMTGDYDGDSSTDWAVYANKTIHIDYARNGFGGAAWDTIIGGITDENTRILEILPGDYDKNGKDDICFRVHRPIYESGQIVGYETVLLIDYAEDGFQGFEKKHSSPGGPNDHAVPAADFDGDGKADYSYVDYSGIWVVDYSHNGLGIMDYNYGRLKCDGNYDSTLLYSPDVEALRAVKDCGIDYLVAPPGVLIYQESFRKKAYYLRICDSLGLTASTMSFYNLGLYTDTISNFRNTFVQYFRNDIDDDLEDNLFGMFLGEEPGPLKYDFIHNWTDFFKRTYPEKPVLYNLVPIYSTVYFPNEDKTLYNNYLDQYITQNKPSVFYYDFYPFLNGNLIKSSYFYNMRAIQQKAGDIPYWATVLVWPEEGTSLLEPRLKHLRYMSFAPIAYGAKGTIYYDYRHGFMNNSSKYNAIKDINRYLKDIVAPVVMTSKNTATLHNSISPYTTNSVYPLESSEYISNTFTVVSSINKTQAMVGLFSRSCLADPQAMEVGSSYGWLFNKDTMAVMSNTQIALNGDYRSKVYLSPRIDSYASSLNPNYTTVSTTYLSPSSSYLFGRTIFFIPLLQPGEGMFFKVSTTSTPCPADYDGDGVDDFAVKTVFGDWIIDYSSNGFGGCDVCISGCGGAESTPVPADYDNDGMADISFKTTGQVWKIDYAGNGFGTWDVSLTGYGGATAHPVPADYDGDTLVDLSVKTNDGYWFIDYAYNGYGVWDIHYNDYGNASALPVPADYDGDGKADLSVRRSNGDWKIDYAYNGFGTWDRTYPGYGGSSDLPYPADFDGDGQTDFCVKSSSGYWLIDYAADGFGAWNFSMSGFSGTGFQPVPADYDGDGNADISCFFTGTNLWKVDYAADGFNGYENIKTNPLSSVSNCLSLATPSMERVTRFEEAPRLGETLVDVYNLYGQHLLRNATPQKLKMLESGCYIIIRKQDETIIKEKYIVK